MLVGYSVTFSQSYSWYANSHLCENAFISPSFWNDFCWTQNSSLIIAFPQHFYCNFPVSIVVQKSAITRLSFFFTSNLFVAFKISSSSLPFYNFTSSWFIWHLINFFNLKAHIFLQVWRILSIISLFPLYLFLYILLEFLLDLYQTSSIHAVLLISNTVFLCPAFCDWSHFSLPIHKFSFQLL